MNESVELPQVLLFDLGGVLVEWIGIGRVAELCRGQYDPEAVRKFWLESHVVRDFERGRCTEQEFATGVIAGLDLAIGPDGVLTEFASWVRAPLPGAVELLDSLHGRFVLACLSNTNATHWHRIRDEFGFSSRLDHAFLSHELGLMKPDPDCYERVLRDLGRPAASVAFFDDNPECVEGARRAGMLARLVRGIEELKSALAEIGCLRHE